MNPKLQNVIALVTGLVIGSIVNMLIIMIGSSVIPPPAGVDVTKMESLKASMHLFEAKHFIFPFLAHALGTLAGAFLAAKIAFSHNLIFALTVGTLFLIGGIINSIMLPAPLWFIFADLLIAYIPVSWLGAKLSGKNN